MRMKYSSASGSLNNDIYQQLYIYVHTDLEMN